jgi:PhnB protein
MRVQPYLQFDGRTEEALDFYTSALSAKVTTLMRFGDNPAAQSDPKNKDKVMHAAFNVGETELLATDGDCTGKGTFQGFALTLHPSNDAETRRIFAALSTGGSVNIPLEKTFFASLFGQVKDRYGLSWMVMQA